MVKEFDFDFAIIRAHYYNAKNWRVRLQSHSNVEANYERVSYRPQSIQRF